MKSSVPWSAQWRSSNTMTTGSDAASRSKKVRHAVNSSSERVDAPPTPRSARRAGSSQARSVTSETCSARVSWTRDRVVASSSPSTSWQRDLTISAIAQNVMPWPYEGDRPECHQTGSSNPSMYFRNSHASRLLPMPAGPMSDTRRTRRSRTVSWNRSLSIRSSRSRPTNGASSVSERPRPPARPPHAPPATPPPGALPLSCCSPTGSNTMAAVAARWVASPTSTVPAARPPGAATRC